MEILSVCGGLVDIQLTQADSHGDCLSIPLLNDTPSAHLIKLLINSLTREQTNNTNTSRFGKVSQIYTGTGERNWLFNL